MPRIALASQEVVAVRVTEVLLASADSFLGATPTRTFPENYVWVSSTDQPLFTIFTARSFAPSSTDVKAEVIQSYVGPGAPALPSRAQTDLSLFPTNRQGAEGPAPSTALRHVNIFPQVTAAPQLPVPIPGWDNVSQQNAADSGALDSLPLSWCGYQNKSSKLWSLEPIKGRSVRLTV
jgi:hypothetical protein